MHTPTTLYIFMGPPGSGKTTVANFICQATGAIHIWADRERQTMFITPTHSAAESQQLYEYLNDKTAQLLQAGHSVVFDTNFNFYKDREYLRQIARAAGAELKIIQMTTDVTLAKARATHGSHAERNGMAVSMTAQDFERIVGHLEPLQAHEPAIRINGEGLTAASVAAALGLS